MKKLIFLFAMFFIVFLSKSQIYQLPNGGFEQWEGSGDSEEPVKWSSFKTSKCDLSFGCSMAQVKKIERSTDVRPGTIGSYSCRVYATTIMGIVANGNLTTGRIRVGSTTATSSENYNFTQRSDNNFAQNLDAKPDSIVFWAKFLCPSSSQEASLVAVVHDDYDYRDPQTSDGNAGSHVVGKAQKLFTRGNQDWTRYSVPFSYAYPANNPKYILINITTNKLPGEGASSDAIYIDDFQLVYNANVYAIKINGSLIAGFNPNTTEYNINVACGSSTNITAEAVSANATVNIVQPSATNNFTATITISNGDQSKQITVHTNPIGETSNITDKICQGQSYNENGFSLPPHSATGIYNESKMVPAGENCYNLINLTLTVNPTYSYSDNAQICTGSSFDFYGQILTEEGIYQKTFTTIHGCDSTYILNLAIGDKFEKTITASICEGETYNENGFNENTTGIYSITYPTNTGCDSVVYLNLTVGQKYSISLEASICKNTSYTENGFNVWTAGHHSKTFQTINGCDSIVNLNLTILPNNDVEILDTIYRKNPYNINGFEIYETDTVGVFEYFVFDSINCSYKTLFLTIKEPERPVIETSSDFTYNIYPNPATTYFKICIDDYEANDISYFLYNTTGNLVKSGLVIGDCFVVNTGNLNSGIYILKLKLTDEYEKTDKVMIKYNYR